MTLGEAVRKRHLTQNRAERPVEKAEIDYLRVGETECSRPAPSTTRPLAECLIGAGARISEARHRSTTATEEQYGQFEASFVQRAAEQTEALISVASSDLATVPRAA